MSPRESKPEGEIVCTHEITIAAPRPRESAGRSFATWHEESARCAGCGHATVGLDRPYAINHPPGCDVNVTLASAKPVGQRPGIDFPRGRGMWCPGSGCCCNAVCGQAVIDGRL